MKIYRFKPKHEKNSLFVKILIAVGIIQVGALLLFGGMMISGVILPMEVVLVAPEPSKANKEPEQKRRQVVLKKNMKQSSSQIKRIAVPNIQALSQPELNISLPSGLVGGDGIGVEGMDLSGIKLAGIKIEMPTLDIFGTKAASDRVFIAFDVAEPVMRDEMGGLAAFNVVKDEIKALVKSLPSTTVFNIMAYDQWFKFNMTSTCFPSMVPASASNKETFYRWMDSLNSDTNNIGLKWDDPKRYRPRFPPPPYPSEIPFQGSARHKDQIVGSYLVYQSALESGAGAIWILSRDWPPPSEYLMSLSDEALKNYMAQWDKNVKDYERAGNKLADDEMIREWNKATEPARAKAKEWLENENKRRESKGIPKRVETDMLKIAREQKFQYPPNPKTRNDFMPPVPKFKAYTQQTLMAAYEPIFKSVYDAKELPRPRVNIIMLLGKNAELDAKTNTGLRSWARANSGGSMRILRAGKPISEYEN